MHVANPTAPSPDTFLRKRLYLFLTLAVLFTTIFSLFRINTWCIVALLACRLFEGRPKENLRSAFSNKLFLAYLLFSLVEAAGILHTHNMTDAGKIISKDASLVAIGFVLCAERFTDIHGFSRLMWWYCAMIVVASLFCLGVAGYRYSLGGNESVWFYHTLTSPLSQNAVFYTVFVLYALIFLLSGDSAELGGRLSGGMVTAIRIATAVFLVGMIILLSSKLLLVLAATIIAGWFLRRFKVSRNRWLIFSLVAGAGLLLGILATTDNPIRHRYQDLALGDIEVIKQPRFNPGMYFNALQSRLLEYRFAWEILQEHKAWLFGVGIGDSQDILDRKYLDANMFVGDTSQGPHRHIRGFLGYNFHNQYVETLVRDGLIGLAVLLTIFVLLFRQLVSVWRTRQATYGILTLVLFFIPEAPLTLQHGIFLFCFFPLILFYSRKNVEQTA